MSDPQHVSVLVHDHEEEVVGLSKNYSNKSQRRTSPQDPPGLLQLQASREVLDQSTEDAGGAHGCPTYTRDLPEFPANVPEVITSNPEDTRDEPSELSPDLSAFYVNLEQTNHQAESQKQKRALFILFLSCVLLVLIASASVMALMLSGGSDDEIPMRDQNSEESVTTHPGIAVGESLPSPTTTVADTTNTSSAPPTTVPTTFLPSPAFAAPNKPSFNQTGAPAEVPTLAPTEAMARDITISPVPVPTKEITTGSTYAPTLLVYPTAAPSLKPIFAKTPSPTRKETETPSCSPSLYPAQVLQVPTVVSSYSFSEAPSNLAGTRPSQTISDAPSKGPSNMPSTRPSENPSHVPSYFSTTRLTSSPTTKPTNALTGLATDAPSCSPTSSPTTVPPTYLPTPERTTRPTLRTTTEYALCSLCEDGQDPLNLWKIVIAPHGQITTCKNLNTMISALEPPQCDGFLGILGGGVDAKAYCECPGAQDPYPPFCHGLCPEDVLGESPDLIIRGMTCSQWDDWARAATDFSICSSLEEQQQACCGP